MEEVEITRFGAKRYRVEKTKIVRRGYKKGGRKEKVGMKNLGGVKKKVYNRLKD